MTGRPPAIRVAALMDTAIVSGPGRQLVALARALAPLGVEIRFLLFQRRGRPRPAYADFVAAAGLPHTIVEEGGRFDPRLLARVRAVLEAWRPEIVQTHSYRPTALAWVLRRGASWRWVGFFHGTTNEDRKVRLYHWLDRRLLPRADRVVVVATAQRPRFASAAGRLRCIPNAVLPLDAATPRELAPAVAAAVATAPRPRLGVIGRLSHEKGVDLFLEALRALRDRGIAATGLVAGDGPAREALVARARSLQVTDAVRFLGSVAPVEPLYAELDLVVIPSRSEGLPNVLLEAVRADRPVVATRVGAVADVIDGSDAALLVPPGDAGALAAAIAEALGRDPGHGREARRAIADRYSLERRVEAHVELYRELVPAALPTAEAVGSP